MANILLLSNGFFPQIGGIETVSEILGKEFVAAGHRVTLVTWTADIPQTPRNYTFEILRRPTVMQLFQEFRQADIVFENNPSLKLSWPNLIFRKPLVVALHTWVARVDGTIGFRDRLKMHWLGCADRVIACSNAVKNRSNSKALVIANPYNEDVFKNLNLSRTKDFVFLGRLVSDKGAHLLIDAFLRLIELGADETSYAKVTLTIVGDGPERSALERRVRSLNIDQQVSFVGTLTGEDLTLVLNQHRYIVIPSTWEEPFGLVALEGIACGCVPIAAKIGGLPDAVGDAGLLFEAGDLDSLAAAMKSVVNDSLQLQDCKDKADKHLQKHRPSAVSGEYLRVIDSVLDQR